MAETGSFINTFIKKNRPQFLKYKKYILANDWTDTTIDSSLKDDFFNDLYSESAEKVKKAEISKLIKEQTARLKNSIKYKSDEFTLQNSLMTNVLDRIKYFVSKTTGDHHKPEFKKFIKECLAIISIHTDRVDDYVNSVDLSKIESQEVRSEEIKLTKDCFAGVTKIQDIITSLNIKDDDNTDGIEFLDTQKATVAMHKDIIRQYPKVKAILDKMGIDFDSPPPNEFHILNENPPVYSPEKNFWEQDKDVLQYYVDEYKKIDYGITVDGYYVDGWLYFHFNHFVTKIPTTVIKGGIEENEDVVKVPELRDNEILITEYFLKSKREGLMSLVAATRRVAKTTMNGSRISRAQILAKKAILCAGGSSEDLGHIAINIDTCNENINPAFRLYYLSPTEDGRGKSYGIKNKNNKSKVTSNTYIINLEGGSNKKKKETLAGFTPDEFILDEAMKFPFKSQLEALEPALWGSGILRCNVIITGTGGDEDLAVDAITMLSNPTDNRITLMDWDSLEKRVPPEEITWVRKDFGLFLPTQMCIKHIKLKSNLADFLGIDSETLRKVPILVTDWKTAKKNEQKERDAKIGNKKSYTRLLAYHPFDPDEIFLSGKENPFPVAEAKAHKEHLLRTGLWDRRRDLYRDSNGKISCEISTRPLSEFPHKGGIVNAPFLIFEDLPTEKPKYGTYVGGFDDYATDDSATSSVSTFYVGKNRIIGDPFSDKIVASISFRPSRHQEVYEKWLMLMEAYNLEETAFGENFNYAIKDFLDRKHLADKYLAPSQNFTQTFNIPNNLKRTTGWNPSTCKRILFNLFVDYCNESFEVEDEDGNMITLKGVQRIDDIGLLDEIIMWSENLNVDRITSAMSVFSYIHYLNSSQKWRVKNAEQMKNPIKKPSVQREKTFYSKTERDKKFYRRR